MAKKFSILVYCLLILHVNLNAQSGGQHVYQFLQIVSHARTASLGGNAISTRSDDITLVYQNPALLQSSMNQQLAFSYVNYFSDIKLGDVAYVSDLKKYGIYALQLHYIDYGTFNRTDENSTVIGTFKAGETALLVSWSKSLTPTLFLGATVKGIYSHLADVSSTGIAADVGLNWVQPEKKWSAALVMKNAGSQIKRYEGNNNESLPFEIQAGITKELLKAPFRFSLIGQQLQKFDISYADPFKNTVDPLTGDKTEKLDNIFEKSIRHLIFSTEILFSKNFNVRLGYNFLRRSELALNEKKGIAGISLGFGFKVNRFNFSYAYAKYVPFAASNHFTISTNISSFKKVQANTTD